jgi:hypothetical protein
MHTGSGTAMNFPTGNRGSLSFRVARRGPRRIARSLLNGDRGGSLGGKRGKGFPTIVMLREMRRSPDLYTSIRVTAEALAESLLLHISLDQRGYNNLPYV